MGVQAAPAHPPAGPPDRLSSRSGPAWGTAPGAPGLALCERSLACQSDALPASLAAPCALSGLLRRLLKAVPEGPRRGSGDPRPTPGGAAAAAGRAQ